MKLVGNLMLLAFILSLPLAAADGTKVTVDVSGFFLTRGAGTASPLVSLVAGTGDVFTTDSVALNSWKPGGDVRIGLTWSKLGAEVRGFMLAKWSNSAIHTATSGESLIIETNPTTGYGLPGAGSTMTANNESTFKGFEANLTYDLSPAVRLYGGARYLLIDETFGLLGDWGSSTEDDVWNTTNKMLGGQLGVRVDILRLANAAAQDFTVRGHGAFALFSNSAHSVFAVDISSRNSAADGSHISPAVDAGLQIGYRIGGAIELHAGYDLMWLNSVAQATRQVAGTTSFNSDPTSTLVFSSLVVHGAKAGLTIRF
jgi:hypothetical protein